MAPPRIIQNESKKVNAVALFLYEKGLQFCFVYDKIPDRTEME